jgi:hypothetical protein
MTDPADEIEALRAERDQLQDALMRTRGGVAWVISDIYRQQHWGPDFPDWLSSWMDGSILPRLRRAVGWLPENDGRQPDASLSDPESGSASPA